MFKWLVISLGLTHATSTFTRLMNESLKPFLGNFINVYLDDNLVYTQGRTPRACEKSITVVEGREIVDQFEKVYVSKGRVSVLGICNIQGGLEYGSQICKDHFALDKA